MMNSKFRKSLVASIIDYHSFNKDVTIVNEFVKSQVNNSPDYLRKSMLILDNIFNCVFILTHLRTFTNLDKNKKFSALNYIKKHQIPILKLTLRFYESLVILKSTEDLNEQ